MSEPYRYIDPDYTYTDPKTGILRNLANVTDYDTLVLVESGAVAKRISELESKPFKIKDSTALFVIHRYLFQDIYSWAGEMRTVEISKGGKPFFPLSHFHRALPFIDTLISEFLKIARNDKPQLAHKLAEILDHINFLHPFREGNGRTQREFLHLLALEKGVKLNLNPPDNADIYERYMSGTINGDLEQLERLILEIITK
ncbi:cell filamentation protein [Parabacteroides sp. PFB2-12]|uniref:Fic/DOC family protein n=1 Tax=unclassified Parabacteroides TaxID=2649774 RepID=UPI002476AABB|nr:MULTISPECIES: Fic family protein [unclassified Parabacteroides]MDH6341482.1 cell filamentation protein [Parabacteroides sp. PM6-13]MDH6389276.1 cell filamentation protein [Parabacteroides sp. PFB2-12]